MHNAYFQEAPQAKVLSLILTVASTPIDTFSSLISLANIASMGAHYLTAKQNSSFD